MVGVLGWTRRNVRQRWAKQGGQSHNCYPNNPSSSPPDNVAGGGGPTTGDLWTVGPDYWLALWGPGAWAPLLGKRLGRGLQGEEAEGGFRESKDREGSKGARLMVRSPLVTGVHVSCRGHVGVLGPKSFTRMSLAGAWVRRTFARHGRPGSERQPGPRYHCPTPSNTHEGSWPPELGEGCGGRLVGLPGCCVHLFPLRPSLRFPAE